MKNGFKLIVAFAVFACFAFMKPNTNDPKKTITVVIDAGHGGQDEGAKFGEFSEKEIVASIAQKIKKNNTNKNVIIHLTRTDDKFITLADRANFINEIKPDLVLSIHVNNNANKQASGFELYISPKNENYENSKKIADDLNTRFATNHNVKPRGVKEANFTILKNTAFPAVTLELGFISNENDRKFLTNTNDQEKIAVTILEAISAIK